MNIRCFRCGWSFSLGREQAAVALASAQAAGAKHHDLACPRCRHILKIGVDQLRRAAPATRSQAAPAEPAAEPESPAAPAEPAAEPEPPANPA